MSDLAQWQSDEAIIRQAIASSISDALFLEVRKRETVMGMWEAVEDCRNNRVHRCVRPFQDALV
jgi:hypothetical protein